MPASVPLAELLWESGELNTKVTKDTREERKAKRCAAEVLWKLGELNTKVTKDTTEELRAKRYAAEVLWKSGELNTKVTKDTREELKAKWKYEHAVHGARQEMRLLSKHHGHGAEAAHLLTRGGAGY